MSLCLKMILKQQQSFTNNPKLHCVIQEMLKEDVVCEPAAMDSEDVLFLLYTSGSTGKPKGLVHTQAGYLLYAALTHRVMPPTTCSAADLIISGCGV